MSADQLGPVQLYARSLRSLSSDEIVETVVATYHPVAGTVRFERTAAAGISVIDISLNDLSDAVARAHRLAIELMPAVRRLYPE